MLHFWYSETLHNMKMERARIKLERGESDILGREHLNYITLNCCGEKVRVEYTHCASEINAYNGWRINLNSVYLGSTEDATGIELIDINPSVKDNNYRW